MQDSYSTPTAGVTFEHEWEIKRSRFIAQLRRTTSEEQAREFIAQVRARFPDARHHCSAFVLHVDGAHLIERSSDDGEPSGTAGKPMLDVLKGSLLIDATVTVTRYFGGIKLGAGGLVHAYSNSVSELLPQVTRVRRSRKELYSFAVDHAQAGRVEAELRARGFHLHEVAYDSQALMTVAVEPGGESSLETQLSALLKAQVELISSGSTWVEQEED